mmetsp:Transcript_27995/g.63361  ORF Transcript_27995/g.63361 Transcript_27995/m.63361 type:complete len:197 (-) Transcript_27995:110-700(-)
MAMGPSRLAAALLSLCHSPAALAAILEPLRDMDAMVQSIQHGNHENTFHDGDGAWGKSANEKQSVGFCILDKAAAMATEAELPNFLSHFQVDLAACCTKSSSAAQCVGVLEQGYGLLHEAAKLGGGDEKVESNMGSAAGHFLVAARELLKGARISDWAGKLMGKCKGFPAEPCTMKELREMKAEPRSMGLEESQEL